MKECAITTNYVYWYMVVYVVAIIQGFATKLIWLDLLVWTHYAKAQNKNLVDLGEILFP
jgi:hypothetical protein